MAGTEGFERQVWVICPEGVRLALIGTIASRGLDPTLGFSQTQPFNEAGQTIGPSVSLPTAMETMFAATAAPEPEDEPPALRPCFQGFAAVPYTHLRAHETKANL